MFLTTVLEEKKSKYNGHIKVVKSFGLGIYIQADGLTQSGGIVESIWKQTLKKVKSQFPTSNLNSCLILGLGGGTAAKLIRNFWPNVKITGVDIDPVMVKLGKKYLGLSDEIEIVTEDASKYVSRISIPNPRARFDLIITDLYNGDNYPEKFETENYIHLVRNILSSKGVVVFNRLYYGDKRLAAVKFGNKLQKIFKKVEWFYPEANLMLICQNC